MPRGMENYICASEDFSHYDNETDLIYGFRYPTVAPEVTIIQNISQSEISEEKLKELIQAHIPEIKETIIDELGDIIASPVTREAVDAVIDEIYGGSALDAVKEDDD